MPWSRAFRVLTPGGFDGSDLFRGSARISQQRFLIREFTRKGLYDAHCEWVDVVPESARGTVIGIRALYGMGTALRVSGERGACSSEGSGEGISTTKQPYVGERSDYEWGELRGASLGRGIIIRFLAVSF